MRPEKAALLKAQKVKVLESKNEKLLKENETLKQELKDIEKKLALLERSQAKKRSYKKKTELKEDK